MHIELFTGNGEPFIDSNMEFVTIHLCEFFWAWTITCKHRLLCWNFKKCFWKKIKFKPFI